MKRAEIIANVSVQTEIVEGLEEAIPGVLYTLLPLAHGRGKLRRKLGDAIWPEENFVLIAYLGDAQAETVRALTADVKRKFPTEGIKLFFVEGIE